MTGRVTVKKFPIIIIIVYFITGVLFFVVEKILDSVVKWAQSNSLGAELVLGNLLPAFLVVFCIVGIISILYPIIAFKKYRWITIVPPIISGLVVIIYVLLPHSPDATWIGIIQFYL